MPRVRRAEDIIGHAAYTAGVIAQHEGEAEATQFLSHIVAELVGLVAAKHGPEAAMAILEHAEISGAVSAQRRPQVH